MLTLILGGARSGKSRYAQFLCADARSVVYVATAINDGNDRELGERIERHRHERPRGWQTIEAPLDLSAPVEATEPGATVLVDCVTVWLSNFMWEHRALDATARQDAVLVRARQFAQMACGRHVVAVSNEVGSGIVPDNKVAREFRDLQGLVNQTLAREAARVVLVIAGLPLVLKDERQQTSDDPV